ncbi:NnrS family protein [Paucibacter sp. O1-1]|nr:NnrS family protein [Paucibacter sp. O1-1]MDA3824960.1 NnrS family protein [Paucibacter sp. O1-1]
MSDLLQIQEPKSARPDAPQWPAFLELGFRPLYLAGSFWAAVSVAIWVFVPGALRGPLAGVVWHGHEMLWAFIATIAVGFLLTAGSNWTGINPLKGRALGTLSLLWLLARLGFLIPGSAAFGLAVACELVFFVWAALALGLAIYRARSRRNYGIPWMVLALGGADALFLFAAWQGNHVRLMQYFNTGLLCMVLIALLVARRVIPFFAMRAIPGLTVPMHTRSGHWQLAAGTVAIGCGLLGWPQASASLLGVAGVIALVQLWAWKPWAVRRVPLLWILYLGYAALGAGLLVAAAHASGLVLRAAWPVHVIGVGGFSVLIIGMVTRTALGHLGRPLATDRLIVTCYLLVIAAAALRLLALLPTPMVLGALHASAGAWVLAFVLYLWRFLPMLIRPRTDRAAKPLPKIGSIPVQPHSPP